MGNWPRPDFREDPLVSDTPGSWAYKRGAGHGGPPFGLPNTAAFSGPSDSSNHWTAKTLGVQLAGKILA